MKLNKTGKRWGQKAANLTGAQMREAIELLKSEGHTISTGGGSLLPEGEVAVGTITGFNIIGNDEQLTSLVLAKIEYDFKGKKYSDTTILSFEPENAKEGDEVFIECRSTPNGLRNRQITAEAYDAIVEELDSQAKEPVIVPANSGRRPR